VNLTKKKELNSLERYIYANEMISDKIEFSKDNKEYSNENLIHNR